MLVWILLGVIALWMALRLSACRMGFFRSAPLCDCADSSAGRSARRHAGLAALTHNRAQVWASIALLVVHLVWSLTFFVPIPAGMMPVLGSPRQTMSSSAHANSTQQLTVMTVNARYGRADTSVILHTIEQMNVDVLAVQEVSADFVQRLHDAGISPVMAYEQLGEKKDSDNGGFNAVWSRYPATSSARLCWRIWALRIPHGSLFK